MEDKKNDKAAEVRIEDDRTKNLLLGLLLVLIFFVLWYFAGLTYTIHQYLLCFFILTGMFYCVKWGYIYLARSIQNTPLLAFAESGIRVPRYFRKDELLSYQSVSKITIIANDKGFYDILVHSPEVRHPSGYYHFGLKYPFRKGAVEDNKNTIVREARKHGISVNEQKKKN